jgi:hypothetical protein
LATFWKNGGFAGSGFFRPAGAGFGLGGSGVSADSAGVSKVASSGLSSKGVETAGFCLRFAGLIGVVKAI